MSNLGFIDIFNIANGQQTRRIEIPYLSKNIILSNYFIELSLDPSGLYACFSINTYNTDAKAIQQNNSMHLIELSQGLIVAQVNKLFQISCIGFINQGRNMVIGGQYGQIAVVQTPQTAFGNIQNLQDQIQRFPNLWNDFLFEIQEQSEIKQRHQEEENIFRQIYLKDQEYYIQKEYQRRYDQLMEIKMSQAKQQKQYSQSQIHQQHSQLQYFDCIQSKTNQKTQSTPVKIIQQYNSPNQEKQLNQPDIQLDFQQTVKSNYYEVDKIIQDKQNFERLQYKHIKINQPNQNIQNPTLIKQNITPNRQNYQNEQRLENQIDIKKQANYVKKSKKQKNFNLTDWNNQIIQDLQINQSKVNQQSSRIYSQDISNLNNIIRPSILFNEVEKLDSYNQIENLDELPQNIPIQDRQSFPEPNDIDDDVIEVDDKKNINEEKLQNQQLDQDGYHKNTLHEPLDIDDHVD